MTEREPIYRLPPFSVAATFVSLSETVDWGLAAYGIPDQWKETRGEGVKVAVLDTGIDEEHPDLAAAIDDARDFSNSRFGPIDRNGHGSHVSGTIAARRNDQGVVGVAPDCRLLVAKVLSDDGAGGEASVSAGIDWACASGADILSMSFGSPQPSQAIFRSVQRAAAAGKFVICAAGNDGRSNSVNYPGRWQETIAVAAVDKEGRVTDFSSRGPQVDIAAPGEDVLSTWLNGGYARLSGTSMATPFVSGVVALWLARRRQRGATPPGSATLLRGNLQRTATDRGPAGHDPAYGWGLINPAAMLAAGDEPQPPEPQPAPQEGGVWVWVPGGTCVPGKKLQA